jgi:DNA polymerase-3 subunit delta
MPFILDELEKIEKGQLAPVYLLYGDDLYLEEEAIGTLINVFSKDSSSTIEKKSFYGTENSDDPFIQSLVNIGMFASQQIIIYKDIPKLSTNYRKQLLRYIDHPEQNILLILSSTSGQKSTFFTSIRKHPSVETVSIWTPSPNQFPALIQRKFKKEGYQIDPKALDMLTVSTNDSLSHAFSEIEKIIVYAGDTHKITPDNIRAVVGGEKNYQMSDFIHAVAERDLYQAIRICLALIETGVKSPYFVSSLYLLFVNVWAYKQIHRGVRDTYYPLQKIRNQYENASKKYTGNNFGNLFNRLLDVDRKAKSTSLSTEDLMIPLIYQVIK